LDLRGHEMVTKLSLKNINEDKYAKPAYKLELDDVNISSYVRGLTLKIEAGCLPELILEMSNINDMDINLDNIVARVREKQIDEQSELHPQQNVSKPLPV